MLHHALFATFHARRYRRTLSSLAFSVAHSSRHATFIDAEMFSRNAGPCYVATRYCAIFFCKVSITPMCARLRYHYIRHVAIHYHHHRCCCLFSPCVVPRKKALPRHTVHMPFVSTPPTGLLQRATAQSLYRIIPRFFRRLSPYAGRESACHAIMFCGASALDVSAFDMPPCYQSRKMPPASHDDVAMSQDIRTIRHVFIPPDSRAYSSSIAIFHYLLDDDVAGSARKTALRAIPGYAARYATILIIVAAAIPYFQRYSAAPCH